MTQLDMELTTSMLDIDKVMWRSIQFCVLHAILIVIAFSWLGFQDLAKFLGIYDVVQVALNDRWHH